METQASGGATTPTAAPQQTAANPAQPSQTYMQLALYLAGNALSVFIGLLIWNLNSVLADFRDSMLYALLCSIALRPVKDWVVQQLERSLADPRRSLASAVVPLVALPLTALVDAWEEGRAILAKWRQAVQEEFQRRQAMLLKRGAGDGSSGPGSARRPTSPCTPRTAAAATAADADGAPADGRLAPAATALHTMPSLAVYGHAAVKVLKSRRTSKKRRKQRQLLLLRRAPEGSSVLFRWLFRSCAAWLLWEWVRDSWSTTVQVVLLVLTAVLAVGVVPLLLLTTNRYLAAAVFSPAKTPTASASQVAGGGRKRRSSMQSVSPPKRPSFTPFVDANLRQRRSSMPASLPTDRTGDATAAAAAAAADSLAADSWWEWCAGAWHDVRAALGGILGSLEAVLRSSLRRNLHALVSLLLIAALCVGTTGLAAFLSVRVAQEGRATVLAVRDIFPTAWAGMAASTPLLADVASAGEGVPRRTGSTDSRDLEERQGEGQVAPATKGLPLWVAAYQQEALGLVQQALPAVASWAEVQLYGALDRQNLTSAVGDIRLLYETLQGPRQCSERERERLLVALARAEVALQVARDGKRQADQELATSRTQLREIVQQLDSARGPFQAAPAAAALRTAAATACAPQAGNATVQEGEQGSTGPATGTAVGPDLSCGPDGKKPLGSELLRLEGGVVAADGSLKDAKARHKLAAVQLDGAEREQRSALARLQLCSTERREGHSTSLLPGVAGEVGAGLQQAYTKLWRRQFREGLADMRLVARLCVSALRGIAQRGSDTVGDLSGLQRLAQAAADPLIAVGRVAGRLFAGSVGSTTAAALMGGLGVLRLGMGVVKFGMQLMLFLALLYYLLAAEADPLLAAAGMLPLSEAGRQRTAVALNRALGGVLVSSIKLIAFHGCFSWITFRVMGLPLTYTSSVAAAACALLPFVPTYAVALPGCAVLLAQGRLLASLLFFALHFMGYYIADTIILEDIPGGHPYMLSLGILGGIYAFENPLQGCLLGPILLSLLSVFYRLHSEFMGGGGGGTATLDGGGGGPAHRLWSLTPTTLNRQQQGQGRGWMGPGGAAGEQEGLDQSPGLGAGLRVSVPLRRVQIASEGAGGHSPGPVTSGEEDTLPSLHHRHQQLQTQGQRSPDEQQQQQQQQASASLSLGGVHSLSPQLSPEGAASVAGGVHEDAGHSSGGELDSAANSFSFNRLSFGTEAVSKPHGD